MGLFSQLCTNTVMIVMLATFVMLVIFFAVLYFFNQRKRSMFMLLLSGCCQLLLVVFLYAEKVTGDAGYLMMSNITNVLLVTLWAEAIFTILEITTSRISLIIINALNVSQAFAFYLSTGTNHIVNIISAVFIGLIAIYCAGKILVLLKGRKRDVRSAAVILIIFGVHNLVRAGYRVLNPQYLTSFAQLDDVGSFFMITSLAFSYIINFLILFLHYNDLTLRIQALLNFDSLTQVYSRNMFFDMFNHKLAEVRRGARKLTVAMIDIDNFKRINDTYGHLTGDRVLSGFASCVKMGLRENDIIGRVGGEEFMLVLDVDSEEGGITALKRLREHISNCKIIENEKITFSCGQTFISNSAETDIQDIIKTADRKMYEAKALGKDRIV